MLDLSNFLGAKTPQKTAGSYWQDQALEIAKIFKEDKNEEKKQLYMKLCRDNQSMIGTYKNWAQEIAANPNSRKPAAVFWFKVSKKGASVRGMLKPR